MLASRVIATSPAHGRFAFAHGVASGEPTTSSLAIWTRVTTADPRAELRWEVDAEAGGRRTGTVNADRSCDHAVTVVVGGLAAGTGHRYRFVAPDATTSPEGTARTLPARADRLRVGVTCCARYTAGSFLAYRRLAEERPDLVLHLGDYIYEDVEVLPGGRRPDPPYEPRTLEDYRRRYAHYALDADLRRLHHAAPMQLIWDDHEVADNAPTETTEQARRRRRAGQQAWREWLPVAPAGDRARAGTPPGDIAPGELDRVLRIGGLADIVMLDTRFTGRQPMDTAGPAPEPRRRRELLNAAQWEWLEQVMAASTAPWRILANEVHVAPMRLGYVPTLRRWPPWAPVVNPDQWDGYPAERDRLFALLARCGPTLLLSGDLHSSWVRTIRHRRRDVAVELTAPAVAGESYAAAFRARTRLPTALLRAAITTFNRHIDFVDLRRHGALVLDVTPDAVHLEFLLGDPDPLARHRFTVPAGK